MRSLALAAGILLQSDLCQADKAPADTWLLVCPPAYLPAIEPLIAQRRADGLKVLVIAPADAPDALEAQIRQQVRHNGSSTYALLAGDAAVPGLTGTVGRMKEQATDYGYGLPDSRGVPTVAVGRFPARNPDELRSMVLKTLKFEQSPTSTEWRNRLVLLAGNPGGGRLAEGFVESVTISRLARLDPAWSLRAIFNNPGSRYYLPPARARDASMRLLEEGELFSIFLGHSQANAMWLAHTNYFTADDWVGLRIAAGAGVLFSCGCFVNQRGAAEGYGLVAMRNPDGPVAVIGPSGESYAAPGLLAADGLLGPLSRQPFPARLGDYWIAVQNGLAQGGIEESTFKLYDQFDGSRGTVPLEAQRREHIEMWTLLGDPAVRLPLVPQTISLRITEGAIPGKTMFVSGVLPRSLSRAEVTLSLERPLLSLPADLEPVSRGVGTNVEASDQIAVRNHERANQFQITSTLLRAKGVHFESTIEIPAKGSWLNLVVRAFAKRQGAAAQGVVIVPVKVR
jgi:hypothetical protein